MEVIQFKSVAHLYFKEEGGSKPNTVRKIETGDARDRALSSNKQPKYIRISNAEAPRFTFKRKITDITYWNGQWIISWQHEGKIRY